MSGSFLDTYQKTKAKVDGIPRIEMNAPVVPINKLAQIGLEVEVEPAPASILPTEGHLERIVGEVSKCRWVVHPDNSLRNGGLEYVLSTPCRPNEVDTMLGGLYETFALIGSRLNLTNRCSTHVHVNVGGRKINELTSTVALWTMFEEVLINWCGEQRTNNHFCLSGKDTTALITTWDRYLQKGALDPSEGMKYSALNVRNMRTLGSFEFRTMRADEDWHHMADWAKLCNGLVNYACTRYTNPERLAGDVSERGGREILTDICSFSQTRPVFLEGVFGTPGNEDFNLLCLEGFRRAQPLVLGYPWHNWMPLIEEVYTPNPFKVKLSSKPDPEEAIDVGLDWGEIRDVPEPPRQRFAVRPIMGDDIRGADAEPRRAVGGPLNVGRRPINVDLPIEFGDGTPAEYLRNGVTTVQVRAAIPLPRVTSWRHSFMTQAANYNLSNGTWQGAEWDEVEFPWIRNVAQAENPVVGAVEDVELFPLPQDAAQGIIAARNRLEAERVAQRVQQERIDDAVARINRLAPIVDDEPEEDE